MAPKMSSVNRIAIRNRDSYWIRSRSSNQIVHSVQHKGIKISPKLYPEAEVAIKRPTLSFLTLGGANHFCFRDVSGIFTNHEGLKKMWGKKEKSKVMVRTEI